MTSPTSPIATRTILAVAGASLVVGLLITPVSAAGKRAYPLPAGSMVAGVLVAGLTPEAAAEKVDQTWESFATGDWGLRAGTAILTIAPLDMGIGYDSDALVAALESAQTAPRNLYGHLARLVKPSAPVKVDLPLTLDETRFNAWMESERAKVEVQPRDAKIDWASKAVVAEQAGVLIDAEAWRSALTTPLVAFDPRSIALPVNDVPAKVTAESLGAVDFEKPFATFTTSFDAKQASRSSNIAVAVAKWQGTSIGPGETISFNTHVGARSVANGYKSAPVYENRRVSEGLGGGICQVSTTLYNAALLAGLEVVERGGHSRPCAYAPPGRDATVSWPNKDLKLRNPYNFPLLFNATVSGGTVTFTLFGDPTRVPAITLEESVEWTGGPGEAVRVLDTSLPVGMQRTEDKGFAGRRITVTRIWNAGSETERREKVSTDRITALKPLVHYNPGEGGAVAVEPAASEPEPETDEPEPFF